MPTQEFPYRSADAPIATFPMHTPWVPVILLGVVGCIPIAMMAWGRIAIRGLQFIRFATHDLLVVAISLLLPFAVLSVIRTLMIRGGTDSLRIFKTHVELPRRFGQSVDSFELRELISWVEQTRSVSFLLPIPIPIVRRQTALCLKARGVTLRFASDLFANRDALLEAARLLESACAAAGAPTVVRPEAVQAIFAESARTMKQKTPGEQTADDIDARIDRELDMLDE